MSSTKNLSFTGVVYTENDPGLSAEGYRGIPLIRISPLPQDHNRALGIFLLDGPRVGRFLMREVTL